MSKSSDYLITQWERYSYSVDCNSERKEAGPGFVCSECVDDYAIQLFIRANATYNHCTFCNRQDSAMIAASIDSVFDEIELGLRLSGWESHPPDEMPNLNAIADRYADGMDVDFELWEEEWCVRGDEIPDMVGLGLCDNFRLAVEEAFAGTKWLRPGFDGRVSPREERRRVISHYWERYAGNLKGVSEFAAIPGGWQGCWARIVGRATDSVRQYRARQYRKLLLSGPRWPDFPPIPDHLKNASWEIAHWLKLRGVGRIEAAETSEWLVNFSQWIEGSKFVTTVSASEAWYRARAHEADVTCETADQLGTPPTNLAIHPNRMTPKGAPAFYGASDAGTAVKEIRFRPEEGKDVSIGVFHLSKDASIVDLVGLPSIPSIFDNEESVTGGFIRFMQSFVYELARPIEKDGREHSEYGPTQAIVQALRYIVKSPVGDSISGLKFRSAQKASGECIVLFVDNEHCVDKVPDVGGELFLILDRTIIFSDALSKQLLY